MAEQKQETLRESIPPQCAITSGRVTMAAKGLEVEIETELGPRLLLLECERGEYNDSVALVFSEDFERLLAAAKAALLVLYQTNNPDDLINETIADLESAITKAATRDESEGQG